jgi:hypothetical protein
MKQQRRITLHSGFQRKSSNSKYKFDAAYYKSTNFLTTGDLVSYKIVEFRFMKRITRKSVILIYSSNTTKSGKWRCCSTYEINEINEKKINFGEIANDKLWLISNEGIFILNLFTFQYRKILLESNVCIIIKSQLSYFKI